MKQKPDELKLIYIHKIGYNTKKQGYYEFIFSKNPENIDIQRWGWDLSPACDNANPPTKEYIDSIYSLKTDSFDLICLHEAVDRSYLHGYHNIHCLAYEDIDSEIINEKFDDYDNIFSNNVIDESINNDDLPLLVFHYRMTFQDVQDLLYQRDIILKNNEFIQAKNIEILK
jgi:hypothetical protein